jgi:preprotein translocase subunit SecG
MQQVVLVIHLLLAVALVGVVLLQKSEGGGLGIGGGGGGMSGFMTGRGQANLLTRATAILAAAFMVTSLALAVLASGTTRPTSILDAPTSEQTAPAPTTETVPIPLPAPESAPVPDAAPESPATPAPAEDAAPATPTVPLGQ